MEEQLTTLQKFKKAIHRHWYARKPIMTFEDDACIKEYPCRCGARKVVRTQYPPVLHGVCPSCGGCVVYDSTRPKTYVGTDVYCDENLYGEWYCTKCHRVGDDDFSGDFKPAPVTTTLYYDADGNRIE